MNMKNLCLMLIGLILFLLSMCSTLASIKRHYNYQEMLSKIFLAIAWILLYFSMVCLFLAKHAYLG